MCSESPSRKETVNDSGSEQCQHRHKVPSASATRLATILSHVWTLSVTICGAANSTATMKTEVRMTRHHILCQGVSANDRKHQNMNNKQRAKKIQDQIRSILLTDWDPIHVAEVPDAADEYDAYIGGIYRLLYSHASVEDVARHLHEIMITSIGLSSRGADDHRDVAKKLCALDVRL